MELIEKFKNIQNVGKLRKFLYINLFRLIIENIYLESTEAIRN